MVTFVPYLTNGEGIPHNLNIPHDLITYDPYREDHLDSPISIIDDIISHGKPSHHNDAHHQLDHLVFKPSIHHGAKKKKKPSVAHSTFSSSHGVLSSHHPHLSHQPSAHHPSLPHQPSPHHPHPSLPVHPPKSPPHTTSFHPPKSTFSVHTSASSLHPLYPDFHNVDLGYDPYLYNSPIGDEGAIFHEHVHNVLDKTGPVHDAPPHHHFPSFGYNLDPYFNDFPVFGYFDYTPKYDHHRRRRGTIEPHSHGKHPSFGGNIIRPQSRQLQTHGDARSGRYDTTGRNSHPLARRVSMSQFSKSIAKKTHGMPLLPRARGLGEKSEFFKT